MQLVEGAWVYSASDLNNDLECEHLTELERRLALGIDGLKRPEPDETAQLLSRKGDEHEQRHLEVFKARYGDDIALFPNRIGNTRAAMLAAEGETLAAMERGVGMIYQATFFDGQFLGRADFLRRIETPSGKWGHSYEVLDAKLALNPKPYFLIQLCNYSEHLERLQGSVPQYGYVVLGSGREERFRLADYSAYYRRRKSRFLAGREAERATYPDERSHCGICRWYDRCQAQRDADDHLGLVAFMRSDQIDKLATKNITTIAQLAASEPADRPQGMQEKTFLTLRTQAALQHKAREISANGGGRRYFYEFVDRVEGTGFEALPPPDEGDVFFDMEGDPLYWPEQPLEYLFGFYLGKERQYLPFWALSGHQEREAFEKSIDFLVERRKQYPGMHVYHYAPYEKTALRRLSGLHATRKDEVDTFLREEVFVDLYHVVRQALRISQERYSIKMLEPFYGMKRMTNVRRGDDSIVRFEAWLSSGDHALLEDIERYNDDDCRSTYMLLTWLLERRAERCEQIGEIPWRKLRDGSEDEPYVASELERALLEGLPEPLTRDDLQTMKPGQRVRWLVGHLLEYHRRENKSAWWKLFDRCKQADQLAEFDDEAIGDIWLRTDIAPFKLGARDRNMVYTYEYPEQEHRLGKGDKPWHPGQKLAGEIIEIDLELRLVQLKVAGTVRPAELRALIPGQPIDHKAQAASLARIGELQLAGTLPMEYPVVLDLLNAGPPRISGTPNGAPVQPADVTSEAITRLALGLERSYLFVQGPPGTGKSTKGAAVIVDLIAAKKRVGIMAQSHNAIHNLLHMVEEEAQRRGVAFTGLYKHSTSEGSAYQSPLAVPLIESIDDNKAFEQRPHDLAAGTAWLFARAQLRGSYDYLFIDEAGQISLGDAVACAPVSKNVVLLGDPQQLPHVSQGSHPVGTRASILEHLLGDDETVRLDRGVFLGVSYRMHPEICKFVSDAVYEGRLAAASQTTNNSIESPGWAGNGLRYASVSHSGNSRQSPEEARVLVREIRLLLEGEVRIGAEVRRPMTQRDVLVVTPYNRQRQLLEQAFVAAGFDEVRVGTVDKFQGREAPVVCYSMATSSGDDLPRDVRFLFQKNRLNVAVSRAQCLTALVCSGRLLDVSCSTPEQMALVNLLCKYAEFAIGESARPTEARLG